MSSDLIVNLSFASRHPDLWRRITENIPQSIRALRGRAGILKIDCLLIAHPGFYKLAPGAPGCE